MDTNPSGKVQKMQEFYVQKGVTEEDASRILEIFSKYKVFFVEHMMQVELGLLAPDEPPWAKGAVTFVSFCLFGAVPLASYAAVARPASASCSARARFSRPRPPSSSGPSRAASRRAVSPPLERS